MLSGMIVGAVVVVAVLMLFALGGHVRNGDKHFVGFAGLGLAIASAVIVAVFYFERSEPKLENRRFDSGMSLADLSTVTSALSSPVSLPQGSAARTLPSGSTQVGSVQSMLDGLKRKLESEPENPSGWALLAQSYAFTGEMERAEEALAHAVALGLDEADVRQRVDSARRDPHTNLALPN